MIYTATVTTYTHGRTVRTKTVAVRGIRAGSMQEARAKALEKVPGGSINSLWYDWPQPRQA